MQALPHHTELYYLLKKEQFKKISFICFKKLIFEIEKIFKSTVLNKVNYELTFFRYSHISFILLKK